MKKIHELVLEGNFLKGFYLYIQAEVYALAPSSLEDIMLTTQQIQHKINSLQELRLGNKMWGTRQTNKKNLSGSDSQHDKTAKVTYFRRQEGGT